MALPVTKATLSFVQGVYGWTESYYLNTVSDSLQPELAKAQALAAKRAPMSGEQTRIQAIKVSREDIARDVLIAEAAYSGTIGKPSDAPDTAILTKRFASTPAANAPIYLRGIWDELVKDGGQLDLGNAPWLTLYNAWKGLLTTTVNGWGFLAKDPAESGSSAIQSVSNSVMGNIHYTLDVGIFTTLDVGEKVKIFVSGVKGALSANGSFIGVVKGINTIDTEARVPIFPYQGGGKLSYTVLKFYPIGATQLQRVVERKAGRPLYVSRGRAPARKLG